MEKMDVKLLPPVRASKVLRRDFPDAFQEIDRAYRRKNGIPGWDKSRCYCPIGLALAYFTEYMGMGPDPSFDDRLQVSSLAKALAVLSSWRMSKSVYMVDSALARELADMGDGDMDVYTDMIQVPAFCVYIRADVFPEVDGFYVMIDCDITRGHTELYIVPSDSEWHMGPPVYLELPAEPEKLSAVLKAEGDESIREGFLHQAPGVIKGGGMLPAAFLPIVRFIVNVLLYLSAVNADVKQVSGSRAKGANGIPREASVFSVGENAGMRIRSLRRSVSVNGAPLGGHHRSPAMHIRRAHYHTFLTGKGRKQRKLKWLAPIIVNADGEVPDFVTVTDVKK